jgi:hypothetical protein
VFVKILNARFNQEMWTDKRLSNAAPNFCLCSCCTKSDIREGIICPIHDKFMKITQEMNIAAPIFACPEFVELEGFANLVNLYLKEDVISLDKRNLAINDYTQYCKQIDEWVAQKERWAT